MTESVLRLLDLEHAKGRTLTRALARYGSERAIVDQQLQKSERYTRSVRRLLQFGTLMLLVASFVTPIAEFFDRWDPPGPGNDTEMAVFALVFSLCLVLLVCKLTASLVSIIGLISIPHPALSCSSPQEEIHAVSTLFVPSLSPPPLRI
jgi:hypothetical protein